MTKQRLLQKILMDKKGHIALWQRPNLPLIGWLVATLLVKIVPKGQLGAMFSFVASGALFTWAWLEIFQGVNYFRRGLGMIVIILAILSRVGY